MCCKCKCCRGAGRAVTLRRWEPDNALPGFYIRVLLQRLCGPQLGSAGITVNKTIRILAISLALIALMIFATGVVSDWNHQGPSDDAHCPYCHLGHQTPAQLVVAPAVSLLKPVASLPLPEDFVPAATPIFSQTAPRAPPV